MSTQKLKGQTLLITILVLTIALTVALSSIRRTTTDVKSTGQLEESARAFSVAEAGIEHVLKMGPSGATGVTIQIGNGSATFDTTYTDISGSPTLYSYPAATGKGDVATIWLVGHTADNTLDETGADHYCSGAGACVIDICWDQPATPTDKPAVEMTVLHVSGTSYDIDRFAYDPDATRTGNKFTSTGIDTTGCGKTGIYKVSLTIPTAGGRPLALRLRPYYNGTTFSVSPDVPRILPSQGFEVSSTGKTDSGVTRKIVVKTTYDSPASIFDYVLYSNTTISNEAY